MNAKISVVLLVVLIVGVISAAAAGGIISSATAQKDALAAVGGGTVTLAVLETNGGKLTWSVDITGKSHDYEVWVDAHTGGINKIITQPK
jgi:uncharacterized membrane protein YkoI